MIPLKDPEAYFNFADQRVWLGIPYFGDVVSNLAFLFVGVYWLWVMRGSRPGAGAGAPSFLRRYAVILCWVCILTFLGSSYFHWAPSPETLFWDRLPMSIGFSTIVGLMLSDRVDRDLGWRVTLVLVPLGAFTVIGYAYDWLSLRPYFILQYGSLLFLLGLSLVRRHGEIRNTMLWSALGFYVLAKVAENLDAQIYSLLGFMSGHNLKHLIAAVALYQLLTFARGAARA